MHFLVGNNGGTEAMTILNNGNVGVGTTSPGYKEVVAVSSDNYGLVVSRNSGAALGLWVDSTTAGIFTTGGNNLNLGTNGSNQLTIQSGGNVGIGQTSPTAVLHLKAGTATASTAPLKFTSGTLLGTPETGAIEFLTDAYYGTITTGPTRKTFAFLESPSFTTPNIGAATATSVNGLTVTSTAGTLTIANNASASLVTSGNYALTLTATAASNATFPAGTKTLLATDGSIAGLTGTISSTVLGNSTVYIGTTAVALNRGSASLALTGITSIDGNAATVTTNANLTGVITSVGNATSIASQTGTGTKFVVDTSPTIVTPTFTTSATVPLIIGGTATTADLYLQTTSGVGTTGADMHFLVGNNGGTEAMTILNSGYVGVGTTGPSSKLHVTGDLTLGLQDSSYGSIVFPGISGSSYSKYINSSANTLAMGASSGTNQTANVVINTGSANYVSILGGNGESGVTTKKTVLEISRNGVSGTSYGPTIQLQMGSWEVSGSPQNARTQVDFNLLHGSSDYVNVLSMQSGGNVGIGTTSPGAKLDVATTATSGTAMKIDYPSAVSLAGTVYGLNMDLSTNLTPGAYTMYGLNITLPSSGTGPRTFANYSEGSTNLYNFSTAQATFNLPVSVASAGDVSMAYDLQFTNDTASYIRSYAPLYIQSGDPNASSDMVLSASGSGVVIVNDTLETDSSGKFGAAGVSSLNVAAHTVTLSGANPTTYSYLRAASIGAMTFVGTNAGQTITTATSLYVASPATSDANVAITANKPIDTQTGAYLSLGGTWTNASSKMLKMDFKNLDPNDLLSKISKLNIQEWSYIVVPSARHIGPFSEDIADIFGVGENRATLADLDTAGIALAGVKALSGKIDELRLELGLGTGDATAWNIEPGTQNSELGTGDATIQFGAGSSGIFASIRNALMKFGLEVVDGIVRAKEFIADKITAKQMCLTGDDGETVCVTKDQLKGLLNGGNGNANSTGTLPVETTGSVPVELSGCLDSQALNFDPKATVDGGGCLYPNQGPGESIEVTPTAPPADDANSTGNVPVEIGAPATGDGTVELPSGSIEGAASPTDLN